MYSLENKCVILEINDTTTSITTVILSTQKPKSILNAPKSIQGNTASCEKLGSPLMNIEIRRINDNKSVVSIAPTDTQSPCQGNLFPIKILITKATKGINRINKQKRVIVFGAIIVLTHLLHQH